MPDPGKPAVRHHRHHIAAAVKVHSPRQITTGIHSFNGKVAVIIADLLGSMAAFWVFCLLACVSLPAVLVAAGILSASLFPAALLKISVIGLVAWVAQTFIQLTALAVLQVSGNAQGAALAENTNAILADAEQTREHTATILDKLDEDTDGGIKTILDRLDVLERSLPDKLVRIKTVRAPRKKP